MTHDFDMLVKQYEAQLMSVASKRVKCRADAEDAVQETFLKAWMHFDELSGCDYMGQWLVRVVMNECYSMQRKETTGKKCLEVLKGQASYHESSEERAVRWLDVNSAFSRMDVKRRTPLKMACLWGFSVKEIAAQTRQSRAAVAAHIHRGRKQLKQWIAG